MIIFRTAVQIIFSVIFAVQSMFSLLPYTPPVAKRDMTTSSAKAVDTFVLSSDYVIITGKNCVEKEATAAKTLQKYLKEINGITYEILTDDSAPAEHEIIVGKTNREGNGYSVDRASLKSEGVYIKTVDEKLIISGAEGRGTLNSVYEFLKMYLDCRWFTAELTVIPKKTEIKVPKTIDYTYVPSMYYRSTYFTNCKSKEFCLANHLSDSDFSVGGDVFTFVPPSKYFAEHPEYYALINGERKATQLCMTNPDVLNVMIENVQKCLDEHPDAVRIQMFPCAFEDCPPCECEKCKAVNEANSYEGSVSGSYYLFYNAVADHFKESYPNVMFATLAYADNYLPPKTFKISDNVSIMYAVVNACYAHKMDDASCKYNKMTSDELTAWGNVAKNIEIFDYIADYGHYVGIYPDFHVLQDDLLVYQKYNVTGMFGLGNGYADAVGGFDNLMGYLLSNLYWNPNADYNALMVEFCKAYFGDAAQNIIQYLDIACYRAENSKNPLRQHITMSEDMHDGGIATLTFNDIKYIDELWKEAKNCNLTEDQKANVLHADICWRYWKASNNASEFSLKNLETRKASAKQLLDDMKSFNINRVCEGEPGRALSNDPNFIRAPFYWQKRWDNDWKILRFL